MKIFGRVFFIMLWILCIPVIGISGQVSLEDGEQLRNDLEESGVSGAVIDLNVRIHVPKSENPYIPEGEEDADLWATVVRPASVGLLPTILIASGYTRVVSALAAQIVPYGYNVVIMDLRGTGSSGGQWTALDLVEQYDVKYVIDDWIPSHTQWSDEKVGLIGFSYLAIIGALASGLVDRDAETGEPDHLKAIVPISLMSDAYRGVGGQGGNVNIELLLTWIGGTSMLSGLPPLLFLGEDGFPADADDIKEAMEIWMLHLMQLPKDIGWLLDIDHAVDGYFWDQKSSMMYWPIKPEEGYGYYEGDNCVFPSKLPVFTGTGWFDLFTLGTMNYYQYGLSANSDSDKAMIVGEWGHVGACMGTGVPAMETFQVWMRWFDWKIKGNDDCFMKDFPVVLWTMGEDRWRAEKSWPLPESRWEDRTLYLSKAAAPPIDGDWFTNNPINKLYSLADNIETVNFNREDPILRHTALALHGLTSRSAQRWLYGGLIAYSTASKFVFGSDIDDQVFWEDERSDDWKMLTFTTKPLEEDLEIVGPLLLKFWARTEFTQPMAQSFIDQAIQMMKTSMGIASSLPLDLMSEKNVQWVVELNDVFSNGRARNITSGWLAASHRQYDPDEPGVTVEHALDPGYTPFDPFYNRPDKEPILINDGELYQYAVELWPTCNVFKAGHRIRLTISGSDVPHLLPMLKPSTNTIVIDDEHLATLDFKTTNHDDEGTTWKWIGPAGNKPDSTFSDYLLTHKDIPDPPVVSDEQELMAAEEGADAAGGGDSGSSCFIDALLH